MAQIPRPTGMLPGAPAPWSGRPEANRRRIGLDEVRRAFTARAASGVPVDQPRKITPSELPSQGDSRPAAVLCLLFEEGEETNVVLTRRSAHLRSHGGEVSFPGGRLRPGELPLHAALRESNEEIGVATTLVEVIGELTPLTTQRSPALVYCFVGTFPGPGDPDSVLSADASEVDRIFWAPLSGLAADGVFHEELWPAGHYGEPSGGRPRYRAVPFFLVEDETVWGATGRLLTELLSVVFDSRDAGGSAEGTLVTS